MAATFNPALTDDVSKVRQKIGDTTVSTAQVPDETIQAYLAEGRSVLGTAKQLCIDLAAKWAVVSDVTVDDQMQRSSQISKRYLDMADRLGKEEQALAGSDAAPAIMVGGVGDRRGPLQDRPVGCYPYDPFY